MKVKFIHSQNNLMFFFQKSVITSSRRMTQKIIYLYFFIFNKRKEKKRKKKNHLYPFYFMNLHPKIEKSLYICKAKVANGHIPGFSDRIRRADSAPCVKLTV